MKLEYYVFFSSDAFFSLWPCSQPSPAFTPVVPFRNSTSHLLRPTDYSSFLFILLCFLNHLACCFSVVPRLRLKIYMRTLAAGAISLHNDIQDDMGPFSSIPSLRFQINSTDLPANYKCLAPQPHDSIIIIDARHYTGELRGDKRDGGNAALERTAFLIENNKYQFVSHFNYASVPSPQHPNDPITRISLRAV